MSLVMRDTKSTLANMDKLKVAQAITDPTTGEYRTRANAERGEIAIVPMLYNRIRRQAHRAGQSLTNDEINFCIVDAIGRYSAADWNSTPLGKDRPEVTIVATRKTIPARLAKPKPRTMSEWIHGLMVSVTQRYVSQRGWLRSDVEISKREEWRDMYRPNGRRQSLEALPIRVNHYIELDGLSARWIDAVADGLLDKIDMQIIGIGKSAMKASDQHNQNYDPIKLGADSIAPLVGVTENETKNRIQRLKRINNGQRVTPVTAPIENRTNCKRYAAPQVRIPEPTSKREVSVDWIDTNARPIREDWQAHDWKPTDNKLVSRATEETPAVRVARYLEALPTAEKAIA